MDIKPIDFLASKSAVDYFLKAFNLDVEMTDELYKFHVYNLAVLISMMTALPEEIQIHQADKKNFNEMITSFSNRYWELMQSSMDNK